MHTKSKNKKLFKIIAFILIQAFLCLDFVWAANGDLIGLMGNEKRVEENSTLSPKIQINDPALLRDFNQRYATQNRQLEPELTPQETATKTEQPAFLSRIREIFQQLSERIQEVITPNNLLIFAAGAALLLLSGCGSVSNESDITYFFMRQEVKREFYILGWIIFMTFGGLGAYIIGGITADISKKISKKKQVNQISGLLRDKNISQDYLSLIMELANKKMHIYHMVLEGIPTVEKALEIFRNDEKKEIRKLVIEIGVRLIERGIPPCDTFLLLVPEAIKQSRGDITKIIFALSLVEQLSTSWHKKFKGTLWHSERAYHGAYKEFIDNIAVTLMSALMNEELQQSKKVIDIVLSAINVERMEDREEKQVHTGMYSGSDCFPIYETIEEITHYDYLDYSEAIALVSNPDGLRELIANGADLDGFIRQGPESLKEFSSQMDEIQQNDISNEYRERITTIKGLLAGKDLSQVLSPEQRARLEKALDKFNRGKYAIYGFDSIVRGKDDFFLGWNNPATEELFLATDVIKYLETRAPPSLSGEYLLHEVLCPIIGHYQAILIQQQIFPENYPDKKAIAEQTPENPYKGLLGVALREWINAGNSDSFSTDKISSAIADMLRKRNISGIEINAQALELIQQEAVKMGTNNIEWVMRGILGKASAEQVTNDEVTDLISEAKIKTSVMFFSPQMRPGDISHSNRLKKDVPIKAGNRPYSPVAGDSFAQAMAKTLEDNFTVAEIIERYKREGRPLFVLGKYTGGIVPGILVAEKLGLPFISLTKCPFDFIVPENKGQVIRVKEPHLPDDSIELYSYMLAQPGCGVIIVDDESTTGEVHANMVEELGRLGIKTEAVMVLLESAEQAGQKMQSESIPYVHLGAIDSDQAQKQTQPEFVPFVELDVSLPQGITDKETEADINIPVELYPRENREDGLFFVDHSLRGMTMPLYPEQFASTSKRIKEILYQEIDIQEARNNCYARGNTLYILGTTPSGLSAALAASQATGITLAGASNRPQPLGYKDVVSYVGLDGYNYSIYGLVPGDSVVLVTGELTDGEEQSRVIKSLRDNGIEVLSAVSVVENSYYQGRETIRELGIPVHSLQSCRVDEGIYTTNITESVRSSLVYAIEELSRAIKEINPDAEVTRITSLPCSFTRGMMIESSDIDETYVYVSGVSQVQLNRLNNKFISWLNRSDITLFDAHEKPPVLISSESLKANERKYELDEFPHVTIYENGVFKDRYELAEESNRQVSMLYDKYAARIKLLLSLGEIEPELVQALLRGEKRQDNYFYREISEALEKREDLKLTPAAKELVFHLDKLYLDEIWAVEIPEGKEEVFENALRELVTKGLVRIYNGKLIINWRLHTLRWSDRFWQRQFTVFCQDLTKPQSTADEILRRINSELIEDISVYDADGLIELMRSGNPRVIEQAVRQSVHLEYFPEQLIDAVIESLCFGFKFVTAAAMEAMCSRRELFEEKVKQAVIDSIATQDLNGWFNENQGGLNFLLKIIFKWAEADELKRDELVWFVYNELIEVNEIVSRTVPDMIIQEIINYLGWVYDSLHDENLKISLYNFLVRSKESYVARRKDLAGQVLGQIKNIPSAAIPAQTKYSTALPEPMVAQQERKMLFDEMEARRNRGEAIESIVADFDDTLLTYKPGDQRALDPKISFWLNWLMAQGKAVVIDTASGYERLFDKCIKTNLLPLKENPNLHFITDTGAYYNDRPVVYDDFPKSVKDYINKTLSDNGWIEINDGRLPRLMFVKNNPGLAEAKELARSIKAYFKRQGYGYHVIISPVAGPGNYWAIKIYAINKTYALKERQMISLRPERVLALFDHAGEFGVDQPIVDFAERGVKVNVGRPAADARDMFILQNKGEEGAALAIEALVASTIKEIQESGKGFNWQTLEDAIKSLGIFSTAEAEDMFDAVRELAEENDREIAITGISGDIGAGLARLFYNRGVPVIGMDRASNAVKTSVKQDELSDAITYYPGDVLSISALKGMIDKSEVFYHLAGMVSQDFTPEQTAEVLAVNGFGTGLAVKIINESGRHIRMIYASSQRIYAIKDREDVQRFVEQAYTRFNQELPDIAALSDDACREKIMKISRELSGQLPEGVNIYDISKLIGERFVQDLENKAVARISNAYGPDFAAPRVIPRLIAARLTNKSIEVNNETRDYIYASDLTEILFKLAQRNDLSVVDVASGRQTTMAELVDIISSFTPNSSARITINGPLTATAVQDTTIAAELLGRDFTDLDAGIRNTIDVYRNDKRYSADAGDIIVFDIGGTSIRAGILTDTGEIVSKIKIDTPNFRRIDGDFAALRSELIRVISKTVEQIRAQNPERALNAISFAFAGPVNSEGIIISAPTVWGDQGENVYYDFAADIKAGIPDITEVSVLNDNSAAALRYAQESDDSSMCVITVGSGISNKVYDRARGGLLMDKSGLTGEIGHMKVDFSLDAPLCDCGGRGHLGALSSGRAAEKIAPNMAQQEQFRQMFRESLLFELTKGDAAKIDNAILIEAVKKQDSFALMILDKLTFPLAGAIAQLNISQPIDRFIITGGFAQALGHAYIDSIKRNLKKHDFYGREEGYIDSLIVPGYADDMDCLYGAGYFMRQVIRTQNKASAAARGHVKEFGNADGTTFVEAHATEDITYRNYFTSDIFKPGNETLASLCGQRSVMVVVDSAVYARYREPIEKYLSAHNINYTLYPWQGGEERKDLESVLGLIDRAMKDKMDRKAMFVVIGGGALMDVVGLAAQLYRRQVDYIRVPTTLLGLVDAAVGVKVGVDYEGHKNLLGSFYPPYAVVSDPSFLDGLDARQIRAGIAEILKIAIVSDRELFEEIARDGRDFVEDVSNIRRGDTIKRAAVALLKHLQRDFYERDLMRHVDFGHTFTHHIEDISEYSILHGEAVAMDMLISSYIAMRRGILPRDVFEKIVSVIEAVGLPFNHESITLENLWAGVEKAKAHKGGKLRMLVPKDIGQTVFISSISRDELGSALLYFNTLSGKELPGDGFIHQGPESLKAFSSRLEQIRHNDIASQFRERIVAIKGLLINPDLDLSLEQRTQLQTELKKFEDGRYSIFGFESIVLGHDDFFLGWNNPATEELFLATDVIKYLETRAPPSLSGEYLLHEVLCPIVGHYQAILIQQQIFPENYPDKNALQNQTPQNSYKGLLGEALRQIINKQDKTEHRSITREREKELAKIINDATDEFCSHDFKDTEILDKAFDAILKAVRELKFSYPQEMVKAEKDLELILEFYRIANMDYPWALNMHAAAELGKIIPGILSVVESERTVTRVNLIGIGSPQHYSMWNELSCETLAGDLRGVYDKEIEVGISKINEEAAIAEILEEIKGNPPHIIGLSILPGSLELVDSLIEKLNGLDLPHKPILVLGNQIPSYFPDEMLEKYGDVIIVRGEGEESLRGLVEYVRGNMQLRDIPNLVYRQDSAIIRTELKTPDLRELIYPPSNDTIGDIVERGGNAVVQASRGCYWGKCIFCTRTSFRHGRRWEGFSVERVLKDIEAKVKVGITELEFCDDEFTGGRVAERLERVEKIADGIEQIRKKYGVNLTFRIFTRPDFIYWGKDEEGNQRAREILLRLKEVGLVKVYMGIEAGCDSMMKSYNRGITINQAKEALRILEELGLGTDIGFIMFGPELTLDEMMESIRFFRDANLIHYNQWPFRPLVLNQGAPLKARLKRQGNLIMGKDVNYMKYFYLFKDANVAAIAQLVDDASEPSRFLFYAIKILSKKYFDESKRDAGTLLAQDIVERNGRLYLDLMEELGKNIKTAPPEKIQEILLRHKERVRALALEVATAVKGGRINDPDGRVKEELEKFEEGLLDESQREIINQQKYSSRIETDWKNYRDWQFRPADKFDQDGNILPFYGLTNIAWVDEANPLHKKLIELQNALKTRLEEAGMADCVFFLDPQSFHMTICDIDPSDDYNATGITPEQYRQRYGQIQEAFAKIGKPGKISGRVRGIGLKRALVSVVEFPDAEQLLKIQDMECVIKQSTGVSKREFLGHISLGYMVKQPQDREKFIEILKEFNRESDLGDFAFDSFDYVAFTDMNNYIPIARKNLATGEKTPLLDVNEEVELLKRISGEVITEQDLREKRITYAMFKPDSFTNNTRPDGSVFSREEVIRDLEALGFTVIAQGAPRQKSREEMSEFYGMHRSKPFFEGLLDYATSAPVVPLILKGPENAWSFLRDNIDAIREKYGMETVTYGEMKVIKNRLHASDSYENVFREAGLIFTADELKQIFGRYYENIFEDYGNIVPWDIWHMLIRAGRLDELKDIPYSANAARTGRTQSVYDHTEAAVLFESEISRLKMPDALYAFINYRRDRNNAEINLDQEAVKRFVEFYEAIPEKELKLLRFALALHDLGKIRGHGEDAQASLEEAEKVLAHLPESFGLNEEEKKIVLALVYLHVTFNCAHFGELVLQDVPAYLHDNNVNAEVYYRLAPVLYIADVASVEQGKLSDAHLNNAIFISNPGNFGALVRDWADIRLYAGFCGEGNEAIDFSKSLNIAPNSSLKNALDKINALDPEGYRYLMGDFLAKEIDFYYGIFVFRNLNKLSEEKTDINTLVKFLYLAGKIKQAWPQFSAIRFPKGQAVEYAERLNSVLSRMSLEQIHDYFASPDTDIADFSEKFNFPCYIKDNTLVIEIDKMPAEPKQQAGLDIEALKQVHQASIDAWKQEITRDRPSCDVLIITAGTEAMSKAYRDMLEHEARYGLIVRKDVPVLVLPDPEGIKPGNGGALAIAIAELDEQLEVLAVLYPHLQGRKLEDLRIVVVQAGGFGSRMILTLAHASKPLIKLFGKVIDGKRIAAILDLVIKGAYKFTQKLEGMQQGGLVGLNGDTLLITEPEIKDGMDVIVYRESKRSASNNFGIIESDENGRVIEDGFREKPDLSQDADFETGYVNVNTGNMIVTGENYAVFLAKMKEIGRILMDGQRARFEVDTANDIFISRNLSNNPARAEEHLRSRAQQDDGTINPAKYDFYRDIDLRARYLPNLVIVGGTGGKTFFRDLGLMSVYLDDMLGEGIISEIYGFEQEVDSYEEEPGKNPDSRRLLAYYERDVIIGRSVAYRSRLKQGTRIGNNCLVYAQGRIEMDDDQILTDVACRYGGANIGYAKIYMNIEDNPKAKLEKATLFGKPLLELLEEKGLLEKLDIKPGMTLLDLPIWPVTTSPITDMRLIRWLATDEMPPQEYLYAVKMSLKDITSSQQDDRVYDAIITRDAKLYDEVKRAETARHHLFRAANVLQAIKPPALEEIQLIEQAI